MFNFKGYFNENISDHKLTLITILLLLLLLLLLLINHIYGNRRSTDMSYYGVNSVFNEFKADSN